MRTYFLLFLLSLGLLSKAQEPYVNLNSPHNSVKTFLANLQPENHNDSLAAQPFLTSNRDMKSARKTAVQFKRVLDGRGIYIYFDEIPKSPNYLDSASKKNKYILIEEYKDIFLLKADNGKWYFSDSSIDAIKELYKETFRFGTGELLNLLPKLGTKKTFGLYTYQYITIFILALISALVYRFFAFFTERIFSRIVKKFGYEGEASEKYLWQIARPTSVLIIVGLLLLFTPALQLPVTYSKYVNIILRVMMPLFGTIILYRLVNIISVFLMRMAQTTESTLDDQLVPLLRKTLKTFVIIIGTLLILDNLDVPILPLLTGLSIGGLAFALAAQDTIKNFFGSVMIFVDKPFQVGDWITANDVDGTVEEVGFRSSRVRTFRNSVIYVPNGRLADNTIDNHGLRKYRRFYTQISITYDTPPEMIDVFVKGLRKIVEDHPKTWKDNYHVYFNEMSSSSLNIMFYIFFNVPSWGEELQARHEILMSIVRLGKELGVNFAFPTQTLHIENLPGQPSLSPSYMSGHDAEMKLESMFKK
ncbi:MscS family membrane protein [Ekhidna lutea]|uniref:MscS family membrane protein n=1 Tax=Ekhidna lutea TaxID=447679 RepID=A0A239HH60_EKHLU|nr:mechanosensitive ion channel family protein [Ekhidna lutea]SNS80652.1 MscS family membrane protein [Ekhidna lutea]